MALLVDQFTLSQDATFQKRVQESLAAAAIAIHNEAYTALTAQRDALGKIVLNNLSTWASIFSVAVASDATVSTLAGSPPVQGNVTDAAINAAVSAMWNSYAVKD